MKSFYKLLIIFLLAVSFSIPLKAETYFLDFKFIIDKSEAGKKANKLLKKELDEGIKKLKNKEKQIQEEEKEIIQQKKIISPEKYKEKIDLLRSKVSTLQKDRNKILDTVSKKRSKARKVLFETLNPIVKNYMEEKNIKLVLDKKSVLLGSDELDITNDIMSKLNEKLKSINLN